MKDLIIAAYDGSLQALRMFNAITELKFSWLSDVSSALVVTRDAEGRLDVQATYRPGAHQGPEGPAGARRRLSRRLNTASSFSRRTSACRLTF